MNSRHSIALKSCYSIRVLKVLYVPFPALGFGQEQRAAGQCQGNDLWLKSAKEQIFKYCVLLFVIVSMHNIKCMIKNSLSLFLTILQAKEELLILQQLLYGVQAYVDGVHIKQRLQNIGAQPSSPTSCFGVVKYP